MASHSPHFFILFLFGITVNGTNVPYCLDNYMTCSPNPNGNTCGISNYLPTLDVYNFLNSIYKYRAALEPYYSVNYPCVSKGVESVPDTCNSFHTISPQQFWQQCALPDYLKVDKSVIATPLQHCTSTLPYFVPLDTNSPDFIAFIKKIKESLLSLPFAALGNAPNLSSLLPSPADLLDVSKMADLLKKPDLPSLPKIPDLPGPPKIPDLSLPVPPVPSLPIPPVPSLPVPPVPSLPVPPVPSLPVPPVPSLPAPPVPSLPSPPNVPGLPAPPEAPGLPAPPNPPPSPNPPASPKPPGKSDLKKAKEKIKAVKKQMLTSAPQSQAHSIQLPVSFMPPPSSRFPVDFPTLQMPPAPTTPSETVTPSPDLVAKESPLSHTLPEAPKIPDVPSLPEAPEVPSLSKDSALPDVPSPSNLSPATDLIVPTALSALSSSPSETSSPSSKELLDSIEENIIPSSASNLTSSCDIQFFDRHRYYMIPAPAPKDELKCDGEALVERYAAPQLQSFTYELKFPTT